MKKIIKLWNLFDNFLAEYFVPFLLMAIFMFVCAAIRYKYDVDVVEEGVKQYYIYHK